MLRLHFKILHNQGLAYFHRVHKHMERVDDSKHAYYIFTANCTQGWFALGLLNPGLLTHQSFNWHITDTGYWFAGYIFGLYCILKF